MELCFDTNIITLDLSLPLMATCVHAGSTLEHFQKLSLYHTQSQPKPKYQLLRLCLISMGEMSSWVAPNFSALESIAAISLTNCIRCLLILFKFLDFLLQPFRRG